MPKPTVAVVGRPNVGKSTLFNKIVGQRLSIIEDTPGVTRDRIYCDAEWRNRGFIVIDTGGIEPDNGDEIRAAMRRQAQIAIDRADVILFVTDLRTGVTDADTDVARMLLKSGKPIVLCVNKVDTPGNNPPELYEFYNLGLGDPYPVSSVHGLGIGDLLDAVFDAFPKDENQEEDDELTRVALIGRPNVGKSSLVNYILGEDRMIVSDIPGTTRDATDSEIENDFGKFSFIDTAGIRKQNKIEDQIEQYSIVRSYMAIDRADVVLILIDATQGITDQDVRIAGFAHERGKASIVLVNKWDAVEKDNNTYNETEKIVREELKYMSYAPILFISAKTGQRVDKIFPLIKEVREQHSRRITTGVLNDILADATIRVQPPSDKGKRLKIFYITQASTNPPSFVIFCNDASLFHFSYQRYLENRIREAFGLQGTPIRLFIRERDEKEDKLK